MLHLFCIRLVATHDVSIRSDSLEYLDYLVFGGGKLEVTTPMLLEISVISAVEAYIVAPKLEKVKWGSVYDPCHHQFAVAPCQLRSLSIRSGAQSGLTCSFLSRV